MHYCWKDFVRVMLKGKLNAFQVDLKRDFFLLPSHLNFVVLASCGVVDVSLRVRNTAKQGDVMILGRRLMYLPQIWNGQIFSLREAEEEQMIDQASQKLDRTSYPFAIAWRVCRSSRIWFQASPPRERFVAFLLLLELVELRWHIRGVRSISQQFILKPPHVSKVLLEDWVAHRSLTM